MELGETRSRRDMLRAAVGGVAAVGAATLAIPPAVRAADDDPMVLGAENTASSITVLHRDTVPDTDAATFLVDNTISAAVVGHATSGVGVIGRATTGAGVQGYSETDAGVNGFGVYGVWASGEAYGVHGNGAGIGVLGQAVNHSTGVLGMSGDASPHAPARPKTGVFGYAAQDAAARGVLGATTVGQGVRGEATTGIGGAFSASTGFALSTSGRVRMSRNSGIAAIPVGATAIVVSPDVDLVSSSFVLVSPRSNLGSRALWYTVDTAANTFTIRVSAAVTSVARIGWLVLG